MLCKITIVLVAIVLVESRIIKPYHANNEQQHEQQQQQVQVHHAAHNHEDSYEHPKYKFEYGVEDYKSGDYKHHREERDGDMVKGEYVIADPDGAIRTVIYTVDKENGFQATVKRHANEKH